jgi:hypothetical protein
MNTKNLHLQISHNNEDISIEEAVHSYNDIEEGFIFTIQDIVLKAAEYAGFIADIKKEFKGIKEYDYSRNKNQFFMKFMSDDFRMYVRGNSLDLFAMVYCKSEDINKKIWDLFNKHAHEENTIDVFMHSYFMNGGQLDDSSKRMNQDELNYLSDKYYPYIDTGIMFDQFFTGAENILLLVGEPGLGKSKMSTLALKHALAYPDNLPYDKLESNPALENQYINAVYVKSTDVLANDKFWRVMEKIQADFCIIDDLDYMLTKRDSEVVSGDDQVKNAFLNQFLSFTDGVEKHRTKFIITTNQKYTDIDTALLRKGRLFDILELRHLYKEEAMEIWSDNDLDMDDFHKIFTSNEVLPADLGSEINKRLNTRIETATESYLKEDGISKVEKAGRQRKIGL